MKIICTILLFMGLSWPVWAEEAPKITVRGYNKQFTPGSFMTLFFDVDKSEGQSYVGRLVLPKGWYVIASKTTEKEARLTYMYTISIDLMTQAGPHQVAFFLLNPTEPLAELTLPIRIEEIHHVDIVPIEVPEYFVEGSPVRVNFLVQNKGNVEERFRVKTTNGQVASGDTLVLPAYGSSTVVIQHTIPITDNTTWSQSMDVRLEPLTPGGNPVYQVVSVPVYSTKAKKADPYHRFPVEAGFTYLFFDRQGQSFHAYQYVASGEGKIDQAGQHTVAFSIRGPNNINFPALGTYDEYSFSYRNRDKLQVSVGDYVNRLNNLMEFSRLGRGLRVEYAVKNIDYSVFYQQARFFPGQRGSFGGSVHLKTSENFRLGVDFMRKERVLPRGTEGANLLGLTGRFVGKNIQFDSELSVSQAKNTVDFGAFSRFIGRWGRLNVSSEVILAGKNYVGFYTNSRYFVNSASYQIAPKVAFGVSTNVTRLNPSLDLMVFNTSPINKTYTAFLNWQPSLRQSLFLNYTFLEREDRLEPASFHYRENFANLNYNLQTANWQLTGQVRSGKAANLLAVDDFIPKNAYAVLAQPMRRVLTWMWIGAYAEFQYTSKFSAQNNQENLFFYGGTIRGQVDKRLSYQLMYRNNYTPDAFSEQRSFSDASVHYQAGMHRFSLSAGRAFIGNVSSDPTRGTRYFTARYTLSLNAPIRKNHHVGHIAGKVHLPMPNVQKDGIIMKMGPYRTVTDAEGNFHFSNLPPDQYALTFDRSSALMGYKSDHKGPLMVRVQPQQEQTVDVTLIQTGGVTGKLTFAVDSSQSTLLPPPFLIKLFHEEESYLTRVEVNRAFSFKELTPGTWTIRLILPEYGERFEVADSEQVIEVVAGEQKEVNFALSRAPRRLFLQGKEFKITARP